MNENEKLIIATARKELHPEINELINQLCENGALDKIEVIELCSLTYGLGFAIGSREATEECAQLLKT